MVPLPTPIALTQAIARNPNFVASFVASFVDKVSDKARDKDQYSCTYIDMHAFLYHLFP